jgi:hypothetical protein
MVASIRYLHQYVKQDGQWLFAERRLMVKDRYATVQDGISRGYLHGQGARRATQAADSVGSRPPT